MESPLHHFELHPIIPLNFMGLDISINKAVQRAMMNYNPDLPTSGWVRGGPIWPKAYGDMWPKAYGS